MISIKLRYIRELNRIYSFLLNLLSRTQNRACEVFLFHDILDTEDQVNSSFQLSQKSFEFFLSEQIKVGKRPYSVQELISLISSSKMGKDGFVVTFDDVNESVYTHAYPFLKAKGIPFVLFVTKELIDKPNFIKTEQLLELASDPLCEIGSHGLNHKMFRYKSDKEVKFEYNESKLYLEQLIKKPVNVFAFPYGRLIECSFTNIQLLRKTNYTLAFSAIYGNIAQMWITGKFFLPRINVDEYLVKNSNNGK